MTGQARQNTAGKNQRKRPKKAPRAAPKLKLAAKEPPVVVIENKIMIKRTGKKTMRFSGERLAEATGYNRICSHWYEIAVFARDVGGYSAAIKHFYKSDQAHDRHIAESFETLDETMDYIESYSPEADLRIGFDPASTRSTAARIVLRAASFRARLEDYVFAYETVSGDVLESLDAVAEKMNQAAL